MGPFPSIRENDPSAITTINGVTKGLVPYVDVRWSWLLFLMLELGLSSLILTVVILLTRRSRMQIIKGSSLAPMCVLDEASRRHLGGINDLDGMYKRARDTDVRLETGVSGVAMWLTIERQGATACDNVELHNRSGADTINRQ
jgi:hypothetical protein